MRGSTVEFSIIGAYSAELIDLLMQNDVLLSDIRSEKGMLYAVTYPSYYLYIARTARRMGCVTRVTKRRGFSFSLYRYRKRYGIPLGIIAFLAVTTIMSQFVWQINISGESSISEKQILEILADNGVYCGASVSGIQLNVVELRCMLELDNIAWISIEHLGTHIDVKLSERIEAEAPKLAVSEPCNVIATHDGTIVETQVYRGTLLTGKGSGVAKGDLIVSGVVEDGGGNVLCQHADAIIIAEYTQEAEFYLPFASERTYTAETPVETDTILFLTAEIPLNPFAELPANYSYKEEIAYGELWGMRLPWRIRSSRYYAVKTEPVTLTKQAVIEKLQTLKASYEQNFLKEKEVVSTTDDFLEDENGITLRVSYVVRSNIAEQTPIKTD